MILGNNLVISADLEDILDQLKLELNTHGIERFHVFRNNDRNIQTNCPFHKGGQERKPSFGVNRDTGQCHCFTCGWSGTIDTMISELFGYNDFGKYGRKWLVKRYNSLEVENRVVPTFGRKTKSIKSKTVISEEELDSYRYYHPYMYERHLTDEIIDKFDIGYDRKKQCLTFPVKDLSGDCVFVATRSVNTKFFGLPKDQDKPIYQAYRFVSGNYRQAYVVESFLNCLTLWKLGLPAMAMIGTGNEKQYKILRELPVREYILCFDPDEAGRKATDRFRCNVTNKIIKEVKYKDSTKDINDLDKDFLKLSIVF